jgi:hypothetical protein
MEKWKAYLCKPRIYKSLLYLSVEFLTSFRLVFYNYEAYPLFTRAFFKSVQKQWNFLFTVNSFVYIFLWTFVLYLLAPWSVVLALSAECLPRCKTGQSVDGFPTLCCNNSSGRRRERRKELRAWHEVISCNGTADCFAEENVLPYRQRVQAHVIVTRIEWKHLAR